MAIKDAVELTSRRGFLTSSALAGAGSFLHVSAASRALQMTFEDSVPEARPAMGSRKFTSPAIEEFMNDVSRRIRTPALARLFRNCYPNTLDTTVDYQTVDGVPDTFVVTGDIPAMWLRDSSAQIWPYLSLAMKDRRLLDMIEGVIRRQTRYILIDPYANAFTRDDSSPALPWTKKDLTMMLPGVGERKYELDSLCYPIRLAHGFWRQTGETRPFQAEWKMAMTLVLDTMRTQQRKHGTGPYHFQRESLYTNELLPNDGYGNPVSPSGLIASGFRPSDDACIFPFLVPSNLLSVTSLRQLAEMADKVLHDPAMAESAGSLASEVEAALRRYAIVQTPSGTVWAYEVDGFGGRVLMDDANSPSLLSLPYLGCSPDSAIYDRTRKLIWSSENPWFFQGAAGEGIGSPHTGRSRIWPMSQIIFALTSKSDMEIRHCIAMLSRASAGTGFIHESFDSNHPDKFSREWFAWANSLFGELVASLAISRPALLDR